MDIRSVLAADNHNKRTQQSNQEVSHCSSKGGEVDPKHISSTHAASLRIADGNAIALKASSSSWI